MEPEFGTWFPSHHKKKNVWYIIDYRGVKEKLHLVWDTFFFPSFSQNNKSKSGSTLIVISTISLLIYSEAASIKSLWGRISPVKPRRNTRTRARAHSLFVWVPVFPLHRRSLRSLTQPFTLSWIREHVPQSFTGNTRAAYSYRLALQFIP